MDLDLESGFLTYIKVHITKVTILATFHYKIRSYSAKPIIPKFQYSIIPQHVSMVNPL